MRRVTYPAVVLMVGALLVSCSAGDLPPPAPAAPAPPTTAPPTTAPPSRPPVQAATELDACEPPFLPYSLEGPPYAGPGPHLVTLTVVGGDRDLESRWVVVPDEWQAELPDGTPDRGRTQLLVCVQPRPAGGSGEPAEISCEFEFGPRRFPVVEGSYAVDVREARTGTSLGRFDVAANASDQDTCPAFLYATGRTTLLRGIDVEDFHRQLRPYVDAPR